ncbi:MAG: hypothetical protein P4L86_11555 [Mycobacterium sp.]|nr:hypothetical protein [Mycobacterium sp.]
MQQNAGDGNTRHVLSDNQIGALTPTQRRDLIRRLQRPVGDVVSTAHPSRLRRAHLSLMTGGVVFMIPWIVYLALTLPRTHEVRNWPLIWVGFDCLLVVFMAATAILAWLHRHLLVFSAFTTGILLLCDAWFDVTTASPGELRTAILTAVLGGVPLAGILIAGALSLVRLNAMQLWELDSRESLWRLPLRYR